MVEAAETVVDEDARAAVEWRERYDADGYLLLPSFVSAEWVDRLREAAQEFVERSRALEQSDPIIDVEPGHTAHRPMLRRLINPVDQHETFRTFALDGPAADLAVALLGGPVRFHHSKLNFKWGGGGAEVKWHQDIQYWPHSDFTPLTIGVYLEDVDDDMGPMGVVRGSHRGECFELHDAEGRWTGSLSAEELERVDLDSVDYLGGPAGSVTVHNCVSVHGSRPNTSNRPRPLLLQTYSAATSFPLLGVGTNGRAGEHSGSVIGGDVPHWMTIDGRRIPVAPDWSRGGYTTIFRSQKRED